MRKAKFRKEGHNDFYPALNKRVKRYFAGTSTSTKANGVMVFKIILFFSLYVCIYAALVLGFFPPALLIPAILCFGISNALIGLNIAHDAVHNALFLSSRLNRVFAYSFEVIGMSSYVWRLKHNVIHHNYPNLKQGDFDIEAGPFLRMSPADQLRRFHRYQHLYAVPVYLLFSLTLVFISDIKILFFTRRETIDGQPHPASQKLFFLLSKSAYLCLMLFVPMMVLPYHPMEVVAAFLLMHFSLSIVMALILIPAHLFESTHFFERNSEGEIHEEWAIYQMKTTIDYSRKSHLCNFLFGGFNLNVVHHLFPRICHVHLVGVSEIVKQTALEFGVTYHETSLGQAIKSHFKTLKLLGQEKDAYKKTT